ncbi:glycosyltransferase family 4 protein [Halomonas sp. 3F2F]|uniref:glycosyltransferase family 4 protein n=1 Tax=Halomonas sp. 3F2F TaxID=1255602 RepID=UPI0018663026|nr:glycosyltransferase family 4 protein [Halomonas sp. 3F2F]
MHVVIPVFFKASHGGLHENILATACFLIDNGHKATIVCPAGSFADSLAGYGVGVIQTDYTDLDAIINKALKLHAAVPVDLVHAHPFASRKFGLALAEKLDVPIVLTFHGKYTDDLPQYVDKISAVLTVSSGVRDYLLGEEARGPEKFHVVPNVPDTDFFQPLLEKTQSVEKKLSVALVSRLDKDKDFILDVFADAVEYAAKHYSGKLTWIVVGDGTQTEAFRARLEVVRGDNAIEFRGWLEGEALRSAYQSSDFVFAPGRCALEAMSCGVPAIAVGSKSYCGLVNANTWQQGVYSNFGGVGNQHKDYKPEMVQRDMVNLLASKSYRAGLGAFGIKIIHQFFDSQKVHEQLLGIYRLAIVSHSLERVLSVSETCDVESNLVTPKNKNTDMKPENNIEQLEKKLLEAVKGNAGKFTRDLLIVQNRLYSQLESLSWLQSRLAIKGQLPPLRRNTGHPLI